ncbi:hypothetical protein [Parasphingopyxis sp.]|uniref:hypothetical protein n=1 Tax=Parasphingopyxis sp. TaxID=1920299 RepID=UPI0026201CBE|nr:hypothetical protein [Parasphingopyxis sp.]
MALKDLAASASSVNEEVIEQIVQDFVRYDIDEKSIVLTPDAGDLSNRGKILVYLTANEGWPYLDEPEYRVKTAPKDLELPLGIKPGSLRPTLKALQKENLLRKDKSDYRIVPANLSKIKAEVGEA